MSKQTLALVVILFFFTAVLVFLALSRSFYTPKNTPLHPTLPTPSIDPYSPDTSLLFGDIQVVFATESALTQPDSTIFASDGAKIAFETEKTPLSGATQSAIQTLVSGANVYSLPIIINTGANSVTVVQLELAFDPKILTDVNINPSGFFENPAIFLNKIDSENGRISYALGIGPSASESVRKGEGTVANLAFRTTATFDEVKTSVTFLPKTFVLAEGIKESALKSTNSAELKFSN